MMLRRGKWDLPKGKLDKDETLEVCPVREVEEETGLENVKLLAPLTITYHAYHEGTKHILKESHWFVMEVSGKQNLKPQTEEDIEDAKWINTTNLKPYLEKAYPLINDIVAAASKRKLLPL